LFIYYFNFDVDDVQGS